MHFNEGLKHLGREAFSYCKSLESADLPEGLESIGTYCFQHSEIKQVRLPNSLQRLGSNLYPVFDLEEVVFEGSEEEWAAIAGSDEAFFDDYSRTKMPISMTFEP